MRNAKRKSVRITGFVLMSVVAILIAASFSPAVQPSPIAQPTKTAQAATAPTTVPTATPTPKPLKVTVAYSSIDSSFGVIWVTKEGGYFEKNGLDVDFRSVGGGTLTTQSVIAGEIGIATCGGSAPINAKLRGADLVVLAIPVNELPYVLATRADIKTAADLKGKALGITQPGGILDIVVDVAAKKLGLDPKKDITKVTLNLPSLAQLQAIQRGVVDGAPMDVTYMAAVKKMGLNPLVDVSAMGLKYPYDVVISTKRYVQKNREVVRRFMKAYVEGIHRFKTDRDFAIKVEKQYLKIDDQELLEAAADHYGKAFEKAPYPRASTMKVALQQLEDTVPAAKTANPQDFIDESFVKQLDDSEFIKQLY